MDFEMVRREEMSLKPKNRERLEEWYADYLKESIEWWKERVLDEICMLGLKGAKELSDKALLEEYVDYQKAVR